MSIYRTFIGITRLTVLWLGVGLFATDAGASAIPTPASQAAPAAAQASAPARKITATAKARARAARIRAARARSSRSARALADAKTPRFRTDEAGNVVPELRAAAAIIYDPATGKVLYEENAQDERSIASITKVMTAIVFLETATDLNQEVQIVRSDTLAGVHDVFAHERSGATLGSAAPSADSIRQRGRPGAGAPVTARLRGLHRADEPEG